MLKKATLTLAAIGLFAGAASAATVDINLYGASAQYTFWKASAPTFLATKGCAERTTASAGDNTIFQGVSGKNYIATCDSTDGNTYIVRVTEAKSSEGVNSVQGLLTAGSVNSCATNNERNMALDVTSRTGSALTGATTGCVDVTLGASDVAAATFNQTTVGDDNWKLDETLLNPLAWTDPGTYTKDATGITIDPAFKSYRPIVVPFSFFVNADNTGDNPATVDINEGAEVPFSNLSRVQLLNLLSGKVKNWNQFQPDLNSNGTAGETAEFPAGDSLPVVLCMRHAGSGTHATLDANVIRGEATLVNTQAMPGDFVNYDGGNFPETYFNTSSSDLMKCVGNKKGALGYADSDKVGALTIANNYVVYDDATYKDVKKIAFNGFYSERPEIMNGNYGFWSAQWLYADNNETVARLALTQELVNFASSTAGLVASGKADWWVAQDEMKVNKENDFAQPTF